MPPPGVTSAKRKRQYEHIKESAKKQGRSTDRAEEIAARTVNKQRSESGETKGGGRKKSGGGRKKSSGSRKTTGTRKTSRKASSARKSAGAGKTKRSRKGAKKK